MCSFNGLEIGGQGIKAGESAGKKSRVCHAALVLALGIIALAGNAVQLSATGLVWDLFCMQGLKLALVAPSLGGVETLITRPATTTHVGLTPEQRQAAGIPDGLIRVAVGVEDTEDLVKDFAQALKGCRSKRST